jgi:thiol:disulfide interchange protein DsbD
MRFMINTSNRLMVILLLIAGITLAGSSSNASEFSLSPSNESDPFGSFDSAPNEEVTTHIIVDDSASPMRIGLVINVFKGGHIYGKTIPEGKTGLPTKITWSEVPGVYISQPVYPATTEFVFNDERSQGYSGEVTFWSELYRTEEIDLPVSISATVSWLVCDDNSCVPGDAAPSIELDKMPGALPENYTGFAQTDPASGPIVRSAPAFSLGILFAAFIGGLILNIMPCVLPVIGIKVMSVVQHAGESERHQRMMGWAYTAGVLVSFWGLALVVIVLQTVFNKVVLQGFQLEDPRFVLFMILLIFTMGLSMLGVFEINLGSGINQSSNKLAGRQGLGGAFFNGFLAVVLSTPCSAPILGTAIAFAFAAPPFLLFLTFTFIGAGLACPFLVLTYVPGFLKVLPKPGAWMDHFKQIMGFVMIGFTIWLLDILFKQTDTGSGIWTIGLLLVVAMMAWLFGRFHGPVSSARSRLITKVLMIGLLVFGWVFILQGRIFGTPPDLDWVDFKDGGLEQALNSDQPVFVDVTAAWCITCKANEKAFINVKAMRQRFKEQGIIAVKADRTKPDPQIVNYLQSFGRAGVPMYVVYGRDRQNPELLPEAVNSAVFNDALDRAVESFQTQ